MRKPEDKPKIEQLLEEVGDLTADLQRVQADFMNFKRRTEEEKAELLDFAKARLVRDFLSVRDTFDRERAARPQDLHPKWAASIDAMRDQFDAVITRLGVERFESVGHAFDPHRHEALAMDNGEGEYEVVTEELQPGYCLGDTILRPAMVKVGHTEQAPPEVIEEQKAKDEAVQTLQAEKADKPED
jgi:molecular chaperone GrpE